MDDDILSKVVEVEKEVQQRLEVEKKISREWLENVKREAEEKVLREEKDLQEQISEAVNKAKPDAEKKATSIIKNADEEVERFTELDDEILKKIMLNHLIKIIPGESHDSPDVKS